jgi:MATE family multidrug resistance protein
MIVVPRPIVGAFISLSDPGNAAVIALAVSFMALAGVFQVVDGAQVVGAGMLRGLHDTRVPMLFAALGYWGIGLPLGIVLAFRLGFEGRGIWIGIAIALALVAAMMTGRFAMRERLGLLAAPPADAMEAGGALPPTLPPAPPSRASGGT